jgi:hypothetical protein
MRAVLIGLILLILGIVSSNWVLMWLGVAAAFLFVALSGRSKPLPEPIPEQRKPRHIVVMSEPPREHMPMPWEMSAPFAEQLEVQFTKKEKDAVKEAEKKIKKLKMNAKMASGPSKEILRAQLKRAKKDLENKEKDLEKAQTKLEAMPFYRHRPRKPMSQVLIGLPFGLARNAFKKLGEKYED